MNVYPGKGRPYPQKQKKRGTAVAASAQSMARSVLSNCELLGLWMWQTRGIGNTVFVREGVEAAEQMQLQSSRVQTRDQGKEKVREKGQKQLKYKKRKRGEVNAKKRWERKAHWATLDLKERQRPWGRMVWRRGGVVRAALALLKLFWNVVNPRH